MQLSVNLGSLFKRLQATIMRLQSDELIQQMRNDPSLYACKMKYIQEIIEEEVNSCNQLEENIILAQALQEKLRQRELCIERMKQDYAVELENIEHHCRELIFQNEKKLKEKDENIQRVKYEVSSLQATLSRTQNNARSAKEEVAKLKLENSNLKQDRNQLQRVRSELESQLQQLQRDNSQRHRTSEGALKQGFQQKMNQIVSEYQQTIQQMQKDMGFIKDSWEKVCMELEGRHQEDLALRVIEAEERFKKEFTEYAQNLKMGSSVVFSDSEEVIGKKVELIQRRYQSEMVKLSEQIKQLQEQMTHVKEQIEQKQQTIAELSNTFKQQEKDMQDTNKQLQNEIINKQKEISRLMTDNAKLQQQLKKISGQIHEFQNQSSSVKQQLIATNKKNSQILIQLTQRQKEMEQCNKTIASQTAKLADCKNQLSNLRDQIMHQEQTINQNRIQLQNNASMIEKLRLSNEDLHEKVESEGKSMRKDRQKRKKMQQKLDRLHLIIRKMSKQCQMLREQVVCAVQMLNNKLNTQSSLLLDNLSQRNESLMRKHKVQMSELLDQMEQKQKQLIENLDNQKNQLKLDIRQHQLVIKDKDNDIYRLKQVIAGLQQQKKQLVIDVQTYKLQVTRLQERIQENQQNYVNQITKSSKEISRCLGNFNSHWSDQIGRILQEMEVKDARIKLLTDSLEQTTAEGEEGKRQRTWMEEQIRKYKKKYEHFKQERDEKVEALLKKLQVQAKHRINLQRQLKQVRMSIMKGTYQNNNNNFSFNDKERQSSNKPFTTSTKQDQNRQRQRELSQIRQMIAKTYKVVDGPAERDIARNLSKKNLF